MDPVSILRELKTATSNDWHWWWFHFQESGVPSGPAPFAIGLANALAEIDAVMPGYAARSIEAIGAISGNKKHLPDYEQLIQRLAEIFVTLQVIRSGPDGSTFADEPTAPGSKKNPEIVVSTPSARLGVEVKTVALHAYSTDRVSRPVQVTSRSLPRKSGAQDSTPPRDNPVKDFLISADVKFSGFKAADTDFYGVLVIVWDDFVHEAISALLNPGSGLLTSNSFATVDGAPMAFPHIDAVVVVSYQQYLKLSLAEDAMEWVPAPAHPILSAAGHSRRRRG